MCLKTIHSGESIYKKSPMPQRCHGGMLVTLVYHKLAHTQTHSNFSAIILSNIVQKPYFDTRLRLKIVQTCSTGHVVKQVNKRTTCANVKCCQARHDRFAFRRTQPRVKVGILYNFSKKIAGKIFEGGTMRSS